LNNLLASWPARLFIVVVTAWALVMIVPDFTRPFRPLGSIGMSADNNGRIISVDPDGPAAQQGVVPFHFNRGGDVIDLKTTPEVGLIEVFGGLGGMQYLPVGETVTLHLVEPNGTPLVVRLKAQKESLALAADIVLELDQVLGVGFVLLAAFLVWVYPRRSTFGFFLFAIWFNPGQYFTYYAFLSAHANAMLFQEAGQAIFEAAGIVGFLEFALRFPNDRVENWRAVVERLIPVIFIVLAGLGLLSFGTEFGDRSEMISRAAYGAAYAVYPLIVFAFITKLRVLSPADALRLRWVIAGCIPGLLFFIIADSIESTSMWQWLWDLRNWQPPEIWLNLCYMVNALVAISVAYSVIRQRVLPIAFLINRGLVLTIVWAIVTMAVEGLLVVTHHLLDVDHLLSSILTALIVVIAAPLLDHLQERLNHLVDRVCFRTFHDAEERLARVGEMLPNAKSVEGIDKQLIDAPCEAFALASAVLFCVRDDGSFAIAPNARGWPAPAATSLGADDPLVLRLRKSAKPTRLPDLLRNNDDLPHGAEQPAIIIPLGVDAVDAFVMYGGHHAGTDLSPDEIECLVRLAAAASAARDHVRTISLRRQLEELQHRLAALASPGISVAAPNPAG
jgi:hypothetical protein